MSLAATLAKIELTPVNEHELRSFTTEAEHFTVAFDLFRETTSYVCVLASVTVGDKPTWSVGQAVLGGHLIRMFKLMRFVMEESIEHRAELLWVLQRLLAECVINLRYLIRHYSQDVLGSYLSYSLQHEKELADLIRSNIQERHGVELPIESRMLDSISRTFHNSLLTPDSLPKKKIRNWGKKNLYEKAKAVNLGNAYIAIFGGPSRNVHGGWQDILQHHVDCEAPGVFKPRLEFTRPRPQAIYSLTCLISETLTEYARFLAHPSFEPLLQRLSDLIDRNQLASDEHENYLIAKRD